MGRDSSQAKRSVMCARHLMMIAGSGPRRKQWLRAIVPPHGSIDQISEDANHSGDAQHNERDDCYERHAAP
jgi:hypothetical protein